MNQEASENVLLIWDRGDLAAMGQEGLIVHAASYSVPAEAISLPAYLDSNGDSLRDAYIRFVHRMGQHRVHGQTLAESLADQEGFSYWWMSHLAEKSPFKSPRIYDCLRLLALEKLIFSRPDRFRQVTLCGGDAVISRTLSEFCAALGIFFLHCPEIGGWRLRKLLTWAHGALPWRIKGLISLRHWARRWILRRLASPGWFSPTRGVLFGSYFFNLDTQLANRGRFLSHQWEQLPELLLKDGWQLNWLHHMLVLPGVQTVRDGLCNAERFNASSKDQGCHSFVESQLSAGILAGAILQWFRLGWRASILRSHLSFVPDGSKLDLRHLLRDDWEASFRGSTAMNNCIWRRLFDHAFSKMPQQAAGFYLWENQGWECAFIHAWRRYQLGVLVGVPHSTIAFWHLNNYDDQRVFETTAAPASKPIPDRLAVNGPMAWRMFVESKYPIERMVPVEAIRFQHLLHRRNEFKKVLNTKKNIIKVLMLGDYSRNQCQAMATCLVNGARLWGGKIEFTVKPHPITPLSQPDLGALSFTITERPICEIIHEFDLAFASNSTSAALDAWLHGVPVAVFLDGATLNNSPMRNEKGVCFVSNDAQMAKVFADGITDPPPHPNEFFWLDKQLSRWRKLVFETTSRNRGTEI